MLPVIDVTDLYHPYQDPDDNLDLLMAFGLPDVELLGVILDSHEAFRQPIAPVDRTAGLWPDPDGPRDPGFIPVQQLNYIFDRTVPAAVAPLDRMQSPDDEMRGAPIFQQQGIELLLGLLLESDTPVHIISQGSARPLAVAYNRDRQLLERKIAALHLCLGATGPGFLEWNVALDIHAAARLIRSTLPLVLYPPATAAGPFTLERHNSYWHLEDMSWVAEMHPRLQRYLHFVYERSQRADFLFAMNEEAPPVTTLERFREGHHIWTTGAWMEMAGRRLMPTVAGYRLQPKSDEEVSAGSLPHTMRSCDVSISASGHMSVAFTEQGRHQIYDRGDPILNATALNEAFPHLYRSFDPDLG